MRSRTILLAVAALAGLAVSSSAVILVGPTGTGTLTFDAVPAATEWSGASLAGSDTTIGSTSDMDAAIQLLAASAINQQLGNDGATPPGTHGSRPYWSSVLNAIYSRPNNTIAGMECMANLQNNTGGSVTNVLVKYDLYVGAGPVTEQLNGHRVYFSLTGLAGSWQVIPALSGVGSIGTNSLSANINLGTWANGASLYLLWADDNASGGTDDEYFAIDNFSVTPVTPPILVGPTGTGTLPFDALPPASQWSTRTGSGGAGDLTTAAGLDTAVNTNAASAINSVLTTDTAAATGAFNPAAWNSANLNVQTHATGNAYTLLMATLQNNTGLSAYSVTIYYDFGIPAAANAPEIPGVRAYYSLTGVAGSWTLVPGLTTATAGAVTATISNLSWPSEGSLYLLWADDNDGPNPDATYTIDNFSVTADTTPHLTISSPTNSQSFPQGVAIPVSTVANEITNVDFLVDSTLVSSDGTAPFSATLAACTLSAGSHTLVASGKNTAGSTVNSDPVTFTVVANAAPTISLADPGPASVLVGTAITNVATVSDDVAIASVDFYLDGVKVFTRTATPYTYVYNDSVTGAHTIHAVATDNCGVTTTSGNVSVTVTNPPPNYPILLANHATWKYQGSGTDLPADGSGHLWYQPDYDDGAWASGQAEFGYGDNSATGGIDATYPEVTVIPKGSPQYITTYFRTTFIVASTNGLLDLAVNLLVDDGAVVYLNGQSIWTNNFAVAQMANPITNGTVAMNAVSDGTVYEVLHHNPSGLLQEGLNTVAVEVHQTSATSSDTSFDLMLWGQVFSPPSVAISAPANNALFAGGCAGAASVTVTANASFFVTNVVFTLDGATVLAAPQTASPFSVTFLNVPVGGHSVVATAEDSFGDTTNSTSVAFSVTANPAPAIAITNSFSSGVTGLVYLVGTCVTNQLLVADDGSVTNVDWYVNGQLRVRIPAGNNWNTILVNDLLAGTNVVEAVAWDNCGASTVSGPVHLVGTNPPAPVVVLVPNGSVWKYFNTNSAPANDGSGKVWYEPGYDDNAWLSGAGELGGGDANHGTEANNPETTVIDIGAASRFTGIYFRRAFDVSAPSEYASLTGRVLCDDGAVVYLNGHPVFTNNMNAGPFTYDTLAPNATADDGTYYFEVAISPTNLVEGQNTLAVEVHQNGTGSSDLSFDLMLWGSLAGEQRPTITSWTYDALTQGMTMHFAGTGGTSYRIQVTENLAVPTSWTDLTTIVAPANGLFSYTDTNTLTTNRFYRAVSP
jgi:hypothetical protein